MRDRDSAEVRAAFQGFLDNYGKDDKAALHAAYDTFALLGML